MAITALNTLKFARQLEKAGFTQEQAEAQAEAINDAFSEALDKQVATKADITELRSEIKAEITVIKWMLGVIFVVVVIPLIKSFLN